MNVLLRDAAQVGRNDMMIDRKNVSLFTLPLIMFGLFACTNEEPVTVDLRVLAQEPVDKYSEVAFSFITALKKSRIKQCCKLDK